MNEGNLWDVLKSEQTTNWRIKIMETIGKKALKELLQDPEIIELIREKLTARKTEQNTHGALQMPWRKGQPDRELDRGFVVPWERN
jgi:hypothetical protein